MFVFRLPGGPIPQGDKMKENTPLIHINLSSGSGDMLLTTKHEFGPCCLPTNVLSLYYIGQRSCIFKKTYSTM